MTIETAGADLDEPTRDAIGELLLTLADDEFVIGFVDSEWTGIAPLLEEDVAMSSIAQDELGHARAFYGLLAELTGSDADRIAYERESEAYRHCRLLDHARGDWATTIARRFLYETADAARLGGLAGSSFGPLADIVAKIRREERYHLLHADAWLARLADGPPEARDRLVAAMEILGPDAATVFAPLPGEAALVEGGVIDGTPSDWEATWRASIEPRLEALNLPRPPAARDLARGRLDHSDAFRWLWGEFTSVRRLDPEATW